MNDGKEGLKKRKEMRFSSLEICKKLDKTEQEMGWKLEALDRVFDQSREDFDEFHNLYVKPLLEEGLSSEAAFGLLVEGILCPN